MFAVASVQIKYDLNDYIYDEQKYNSTGLLSTGTLLFFFSRALSQSVISVSFFVRFVCDFSYLVKRVESAYTKWIKTTANRTHQIEKQKRRSLKKHCVTVLCTRSMCSCARIYSTRQNKVLDKVFFPLSQAHAFFAMKNWEVKWVVYYKMTVYIFHLSFFYLLFAGSIDRLFRNSPSSSLSVSLSQLELGKYENFRVLASQNDHEQTAQI